MHSRHIFSKISRVSSCVLLALFGTYEVDLLVIEAAKDFKSFIHSFHEVHESINLKLRG